MICWETFSSFSSSFCAVCVSQHLRGVSLAQRTSTSDVSGQKQATNTLNGTLASFYDNRSYSCRVCFLGSAASTRLECFSMFPGSSTLGTAWDRAIFSVVDFILGACPWGTASSCVAALACSFARPSSLLSSLASRDPPDVDMISIPPQSSLQLVDLTDEFLARLLSKFLQRESRRFVTCEQRNPVTFLFHEENACGQQAIWRRVYDLMKCDSAACHLGPYCWLDPIGKKHYRLRTQTLRVLVTYAEKGGVLESHKDVPDEIRDELYMEDQQKQEKENRKGGKTFSSEPPYPPTNINVHPSHPQLATTAASAGFAPPKDIASLNIPGFRDVAAKEYDGFGLEHIYKDQNPQFFVGKGVKPGIARSFVENIREWAENVNKRVP